MTEHEFIETGGRDTGARSESEEGGLRAADVDDVAGVEDEVDVGFTAPTATQPMVNPELNELTDTPRDDIVRDDGGSGGRR